MHFNLLIQKMKYTGSKPGSICMRFRAGKWGDLL